MGSGGSRSRSVRVGLVTVAVAAAVAALPMMASAQTDGAYPGAAVELWSWNAGTNYEQVFDDAGERFAAANDGADLTKNYIDYGDFVTRAKTAIAGNIPPDLLQMPWAGEFLDIVKAGSLQPLDEYLGEGFPEFFGGVMDSVKYDGHTWAVPLDVNNLTIGYNTEIFDELGLEVPTTSDELIAVAQKIRESGKYSPLCTSIKDGWPAGDVWFAQAAYTTDSDAMIRAADRGEATRDDPAFVAAAENVKKLVDGGVFVDDATSISYMDCVNLFAQKQAAMFYPVGNFILNVVDSSAGGPGMLKYDLMAFPPPDASQTPVATGGIAIMFSIPVGAKNPEAAAEVLRYLTNEEGRAKLVGLDFIPASEADSSSNPSELYGKMLGFQSTARTRAIFTPATYAALTNGIQGLFAGSKAPADIAADMVAAQAGG
jgi:raffinose/stachyose/melibiose transport system substrate-binding protein